MISIQPSNEMPPIGRAGHVGPSPSGEDPVPKPSAFFYGGPSRDCDESRLSHWWEGVDLDHLGPLIRALLVQSIRLSQAHLDLRATMDSLDLQNRDLQTKARAMHLGIVAMASFQMERVRTIARCARSYVWYLALADRLRNIESGIAIQQAIAQMSQGDAGANREGRSFAVSVSLSELHAAQERTRGAGDQALLALCNELSEPLAVTYQRVYGHGLPDDPAQIPNTGTPEGLARRRPDLIGALHAIEAVRAIAGGTSTAAIQRAKLAQEHAVATAENEVEHSLRALRARISELVPLRASSAAAEMAAWRIHRSVNADGMPIAALSEANLLLCVRRDREIEVRGESYLALIGLFEALGAGWESELFLQDACDEEASA